MISKIASEPNFDPLRRGIGVQFWFFRRFGAEG
jgi:hypothetical protein